MEIVTNVFAAVGVLTVGVYLARFIKAFGRAIENELFRILK